MLVEIQTDFSMSPDATIVVAQIAAGASLFAVFLAGALADRLGDRKVLLWASGAFCIGAVIVGCAPEAVTLVGGLSIGAVGSIIMAIVGLSVLNKTFPDKTQRARAFGLFAVIAPAVSILIPLISSAIIPHSSWRAVTVVWLAVGFGVIGLAIRTLPRHGTPDTRSELLTPALAGIALSGSALAFSFVGLSPTDASHFHHGLIAAGIAVAALATLVAAMRKITSTTLDLRTLRSRGSLPILAALFLVNGVNLFFFTYLLLQYRYHQTLLETALVLLLPQFVAGGAAIASGRLSARWGSLRVTTLSLFCASLLSLAALTVQAESSAWLPVLVLTVAAIPIAASVGPLTQAFMDSAPTNGIGSASSVRNATVNLGIAIAGLITGTIVFNELDRDTSLTIEAFQQQAEAFHLAGIFCFLSYLGAAFLVVWAARRRGVTLA